MIIFLTGLPGAGKSTVSKALVDCLQCGHYDIDDDLTPEYIDKVQRGEELSEDDIYSHLIGTVLPKLKLLPNDKTTVVAGILGNMKCITQISSEALEIIFINLEAHYDVLKERVLSRDHFAGVPSLDHCWTIQHELKAPGYCIDVTQKSVEQIVDECIEIIKTLPNTSRQLQER